jgi:integrase
MSALKTLRTRKGTLITKTATGYRYRAVVDKRQHYFPLGVDATKAAIRADDIRDHLKIFTVEEVRSKFHPNFVGKQSPTVEDLLQLHKEIAPSLGLKTRTAASYRSDLLRVIRLGNKCSKENALKEKVTNINEAMALRAKSNYFSAKNGGRASARSFNSFFGNAKALFSKEAVAAYRSHNPAWDFRDTRKSFLEAVPFKRVSTKWVCPPEDMIQNIHWNIENVAGGELYTILALAFYGGLRCGEICAIDQNWARLHTSTSPDDVQINIYNSATFTAKGRQGYTIMKKAQWERILQRKTAMGTCMVRINSVRTVSKKASNFLRQICGLDVQKPLHELRKLYGAHVATKDGLYVAQLYLRHQDPKTTYNLYSGVILSPQCLTLWDK